MQTGASWLWFISDLTKTTLLTQQPLFANGGLDSPLMARHKPQKEPQVAPNHSSRHQKVFTTEQKRV